MLTWRPAPDCGDPGLLLLGLMRQLLGRLASLGRVFFGGRYRRIGNLTVDIFAGSFHPVFDLSGLRNVDPGHARQSIRATIPRPMPNTSTA